MSSAKDFLQKFQQVAPFPLRQIQTDNGSEFAAHFAEYARKQKLTHFYTYPRHPQQNELVERFNRTDEGGDPSFHSGRPFMSVCRLP